ncbi:MAG: guanylate kinase [Opitutales bacterium]
MAAADRPKTILLILAGPAGVGKSTLSDRLVAEVPNFERVVTATTRPPRPKEVDGRDYHFLSPAQFDEKLAADEFLEWAWVHKEARYGTLKSAVLGRLPHTNLVMNIDVQGVRSIRAAALRDPVLDHHLVTVFVAPDTFDVLRQRILGRGPISAEELERRMSSAAVEMLEKDGYDYLIHSGTKERDFQSLLRVWAQVQAGPAGR